MSGRGRRATFPERCEQASVGSNDLVALLPGPDPRCFRVRVQDGGYHTVDLRPWGNPVFTRMVASLVHEMIRQMGPAPIRRTLYCKLLDLRRFWRFLDAAQLTVCCIEDVTLELINRYEDWLEQGTPSQLALRRIISPLINLLRLAVERDAGCLPAELEHRLTWLGGGEFIGSRPRDAYSSREAAALRAAARRQVTAAARILPDGEMPAPRVDIDARPRLRRFYDDVLDALTRKGVIHVRSREFRLLKCGLQNNRLSNLTSEMLHGALYLTRLDLVGFLVLLSLETGMEIECLLSLSADCLRNPSRGYVEIEYCKRRARGGEWKRLRVRDGGSSTPGGLIRLAVKLTERARRYLGTTALWAWWDGYKLKVGSPGRGPVKAFVAHHGVMGDDGHPLHLELPRLRKTHKAERYLRVQGQLDDFAVGHSVAVGARHYADIPALRHVHERTITEALHEALEAGLKPRLVPPDIEAAARLDPEVAGLSVALAQVSAILDGDQDVWLASCTGFNASPFGTVGEACPTPFWGCLECENAVITARKLPALIAFESFMIEQRAVMEAGVWAARFGRAYRRITEQILPAFPPQLVVNARAAAADAGTSFLYLPPEARAS